MTKRLSFEAQLSTLAKCGIRLAEGISPDALIESFDRGAFEADPFRLLLTVMGSEVETDTQSSQSLYLSDQVWHLDTECIEEQGAYVAIANRLRTLAAPDLPLTQVEDQVDFESERAWVAFSLDGKGYKWAAKVDNDWLDPTIMSRFAQLLAGRRGVQKRFTYVDLGGQDCLVGCSTPVQRTSLINSTGLRVRWLA